MPDVLRTVGRFELLQEVGRGGMAVVWLARQTDLDRFVALKELAPFHAADPAFAARFLRESRIAGSMNHPNIVTVHDYLEHEGTPFISMEYMEHGSLRPLVGSLSIAQVGYVLEGMLAALAYAEYQGIVHRDLKPENVMVRNDGQVKIADFGIAKAFNQASSTGFHTVTGTTVGTPAYMAPEQAMAKELGPWTDMYATGVVAYELLVGQVPFSDTETPVAILMRHVNDPPPAPRSIRPELDERLEEWLLRMLAKSPGDRFQHATDAWDALEEIIVAIAGPRWRRDARVLGLGGGTHTPTPMPSIPRIATPEPVNSLPPTPTPPPAPAAPPPVAAPLTPARFEPLATAPPRLAPQADSFEWPALETADELAPVAAAAPATGKAAKPAKAPKAPKAPPGGGAGGRRKLLIGLAVLLVGVVGVVVAISVTGGSSGSPSLSTQTTPTTVSTPRTTPRTTPTTSTVKTVPVLPDPVVPAAKRAALATGGGSLFATGPGGHVARLQPRTLRQLSAGGDADRPRALGVLGRTLVVADDHDIVRLRADTLAPVGASAFGPAPLLGGGARAPLVGATGHRLCLIGAAKLDACATAPFAVSGVGATPGGTVLAVDGKAGTLAQYRRAGAKLVPKGAAIKVGARAHGPVVVVGSRAFVPISRGLAVVDLAARTVVSTVDLRVTPGAPALVGSMLVTPLPARGSVALVSTKDLSAVPQLVATGPLSYTAAAGTGSLAYVSNADGTVTLVDAAKAKALRRVRVSALRGAPVARAIVRTGVVARTSSKVTVTLHLGSGAIDAPGLLVPNAAIAKGAALIELRQGGIRSAIGRLAGEGVTGTVSAAPGRVILRLRAVAGDFTALAATRARGGRDIVLSLTPKPVTHTPTGGGSSTGGGGGGGTSSGGGTSTGGGGGGGTSTGGGGGTTGGGGGATGGGGGGGGGLGNF